MLSPDALLGFTLLFVRSHFTCHNMPTDNNLNFTQVYSTNLYQENTRVSTLTAVKIARLAWFAGRPYSVLGPRLCMKVDGDAYISYNIN